MEFRILGPLEVVEGGRALALGGRKQRALLARLLLDAGRTVPIDRIVDDLWGEHAPQSAVKMVQIHVSQLRKALPRDLLATRPPGYLVDVDPEAVDLARFERLAHDASALLSEGDAEGAADTLRTALSLWRGPPLEEFTEPFAELERQRLEERRLGCIEERIAADLALGRHSGLVGELDGLVARFPLRERLREEQMLALYRSGRQVDALAAYRDYRARLDEELGLVPSPALTRLEQLILQHDPSLQETGRAGAHGRRRRDGSRTVQARLSHESDVLGREAERAALLRMLDPEGPALTFVFGFAGVGKSALLRAFRADAGARGATVLALDGASMHPSAAGCMEALSAALDQRVSTPAEVRDALAASEGDVVVTLDAYERLEPLDEWLRTELVPVLPERVRLAVAGREAPAAAWSARYGALAARLGVDSLAPADAMALLRRLGVDERRAAHINRVLRGHPLGLQLAASNPTAVSRGPDDALRPAIDELTRLVVGEIEPELRTALQAASVVRRLTVALLADLLPGVSAAATFERLRSLPFVMLTSDGLVLFHVFRAVLAAQLAFTDPARHHALRLAARRHLARVLAAGNADRLWPRAADLLYLLEDDRVHDALFPNTAPWYAVEPAGPADGPAIIAISERHEPPAATGHVAAWWDAAADRFLVARAPDGSVAGFATVCEPGEVPVDLLGRDPVAAAWRRELDPAPAAGGRVVFVRHLLTVAAGEGLSPAQAALSLAVARRCFTLGAALRRVYACARDAAAVAARLEPLGFSASDEIDVRVDRVRYRTYVHDLGAAGFSGWLRELSEDDPSGAPAISGSSAPAAGPRG